MLTHHFWIRSASYSLLAHLDLSETYNGSVGAIIVPPFGWEDICSYRPLRSLGRNLAAAGIPTLRFDLPGTGDSSGRLSDPDLLGAWTRSVADAAAEFKIMTGVRHVAIVGVRLGAMIALAAASGGAPIDDLVLWGASTTGRSMLRELRAFRDMESTEYDEKPQMEGQPGLEVAGFHLNAETENALEESKQEIEKMQQTYAVRLDNFQRAQSVRAERLKQAEQQILWDRLQQREALKKLEADKKEMDEDRKKQCTKITVKRKRIVQI